MKNKFKKAAAVTTAFLLCLAICACGSGPATVAKIAHNEYSALTKAIKAQTVAKVQCTYSDASGSETYEIAYPEIIEGICNELSAVKAEETDAEAEGEPEDGSETGDGAEGGEEETDDSEEEELVEYPVGYFFTGDNSDEDYIVTTTADQLNRQLFSAYPTEDVIARSSIMIYFDAEANERINRMWIRVRCFDIRDVPAWAWVLLAAGAAAVAGFLIRRRKIKKQFEKRKP